LPIVSRGNTIVNNKISATKHKNVIISKSSTLLEILMNQTTRFRRKLTTNSGAN